MVGKQGFIRTLEAVMAILLVLGFLLYILPKTPVIAESTIPEGLDSARSFILMQFLSDNDLRFCVENANVISTGGGECSNVVGTVSLDSGESCKDKIESLLDKNTPPGFNYHCEICLDTNPCTNLYDLHSDAKEKSVYPGAVFMYFTRGSRYLRVYFWRE